MSKIQLVNRQEEIDLLHDAINEKSEKGKLISISGISGIGKSSFFEVFKKKHDGLDDNILCIVEKVLSVDDPLSFFNRFFNNLETKIHPKKSKFKDFFNKYKKPIQIGIQSLTTAYSIPVDTSALFNTEQSTSYHEIEEKLVRMLSDFSVEFPNKKLVIIIDDLDKSTRIENFTAIFEDIAPQIPINSSFVFSSIDQALEVDDIISLSNFTEDETTEFIKKNIPNLSPDIHKIIFDKSGGYPTSLAWVWQNYTKDQNVASLIQRLPREGFLYKLQENFLTYLSDEQKEILKTCASLELIDSMVIKTITGLNQDDIEDFFDELTMNSILFPINYVQLRNKQNLDVFVMADVFRELVDVHFGTNVGAHKKALQYYVNALLENLYPVKNVTIGLLLNQIEKITTKTVPSFTVMQAIDELGLSVSKKLDLLSEVFGYYSMAGNKEKCKEFAFIMKENSGKIENVNEREYWLKFSNICDLLADNQNNEARKQFHELADWFDIASQSNAQQNTDVKQFSNALRTFGNLLVSDYENPEEFFSALLGKEGNESFKPYYSNKISQLLFAVMGIEQILVLGRYDEIIEIGLECLKNFETISESDKQEFQQITDNKEPIELTLNTAEYAIKFDLGIAYYLKINSILAQKDPDLNIVKDLLGRAIKFLEVAKNDPVRGQYYEHTKLLLDKML